MFRIGIDLGGTKIEGIVLDAQGKEFFRKRVETQQEKGYAHILNRIKGLHDELVAGIQRGLDVMKAGTGKPFRVALDEIRAKRKIPFPKS